MKLSFTISVLAATFGCSAAETIFEAIATAGGYGTLLTSLEDTGGKELLIGLGSNVTLFGPNDAAFADISDVLATLNSTQILGVLANHAVVGYYKAQTVIDAGCVELTTIGETKISVSYSEEDGVMVNGAATVVLADVMGEYGVMHGIDSVLGDFIPCPTSFLDVVVEAGTYGTLLGAINNTAGVIDAVGAALPVTVFGPNDAAFTALGESFNDLNETALFGVLAGHVVQGVYTVEMVKAAGCVELPTLAGTKIKVSYHEDHEGHDHDRALEGDEEEMGEVRVNGADVVDADFTGDDGIFHGIDGVILAGSFTPCPDPTAAPEDSAASVASTSIIMVAAVAAFFAF